MEGERLRVHWQRRSVGAGAQTGRSSATVASCDSSQDAVALSSSGGRDIEGTMRSSLVRKPIHNFQLSASKFSAYQSTQHSPVAMELRQELYVGAASRQTLTERAAGCFRLVTARKESGATKHVESEAVIAVLSGGCDAGESKKIQESRCSLTDSVVWSVEWRVESGGVVVALSVEYKRLALLPDRD